MDSKLETYLQSNQYQIEEVLHENKRKKTRLIKVKKNGQFFVAKVIDELSPVDIKNKFNIEKSYYQKNKFCYLPKLVTATDHVLILEFIEGKSLRDAIRGNNVNSTILSSLLNCIDLIYANSKRENDGTNETKNCFSNLSNLLQSGPIQSKNTKISTLKKGALKLRLLLLIFKLKWNLNKLDFKTLKSGFIHGDFHFNNILVNSNGEIKIIDFENVKYTGYFDFDIMYLYAMLELNLKTDSKEMEILQNSISTLCQNKYAMKIFNLYRYSIKLNSRFRVS